MALKNTKGTERPTTDNKFKSLALARGIVKPSAALKNTSLNKSHHLKGWQSEQKVIQDLQKKSWDLQFHRAKTQVAEIDLILQSGRRVRLIEVKTLDDPWRSFERISAKQIQKLLLNQMYLNSLFGLYFQFRCEVAWVTKDRIEYTSID